MKSNVINSDKDDKFADEVWKTLRPEKILGSIQNKLTKIKDKSWIKEKLGNGKWKKYLGYEHYKGKYGWLGEYDISCVPLVLQSKMAGRWINLATASLRASKAASNALYPGTWHQYWEAPDAEMQWEEQGSTTQKEAILLWAPDGKRIPAKYYSHKIFLSPKIKKIQMRGRIYRRMIGDPTAYHTITNLTRRQRDQRKWPESGSSGTYSDGIRPSCNFRHNIIGLNGEQIKGLTIQERYRSRIRNRGINAYHFKQGP